MNDKDCFTIPEAPGYTFQMRLEPDDTSEAPWERSDGHGPVRHVWTPYGHPSKKAGERILHQIGRGYWLYDWQEACRLARRDGWNAQPLAAPNRIERAVQADFDYLRGWFSNDWCYIGVCTVLLNHAGEPVTDRFAHAVWGIESDCGDYIAEVARDCALELAHEHGITLHLRREVWRTALREARERRYWEQRGVKTA